MSSINFSGLTDNEKPSSKVLRPPGGGSSDLFGGDIPSTPRNNKNHMASNIFSSEKDVVKNNGDQPRRGQKNVDSYSRLFGEPDRPFTPAKNHMKSNIPFGGKAQANGHQSNGNNANGNGHHAKNGNGNADNNGSSSLSSSASSIASSTEHHVIKQNGVSRTDGNPVTGEGYKPAGAEINTTIPSLNGANQVINKNRIPPGGFSSGLW